MVTSLSISGVTGNAADSRVRLSTRMCGKGRVGLGGGVLGTGGMLMLVGASREAAACAKVSRREVTSSAEGVQCPACKVSRSRSAGMIGELVADMVRSVIDDGGQREAEEGMVAMDILTWRVELTG